MPYFITNKADGCSGWATIKADGEIMGCHKTKGAAVKQMVAISLAENMKPGGERALNDELEVGDFVFWENAGQTEFGLIIAVSTYGVVTDQLGATVIATQDRPIAKISVYELTESGLLGTDRFVIKPFAPLTKLDMQDHSSDNYSDSPDNNQDNSGSYRIASGPQAVIVDIDDTLIHFDRPMKRVIDYVNQLPGRKYIITGRMQSDRERTVSQLADAGVEYSALFMKQADEPTTVFKKRVAERLLRRYDVYLAIDNDENNRRVFSGLGIPTMNPASIKEGDQPEDRAVKANVPQYMRAAARRGLEYVAEGKGGDGLKQQTINEARKMAAGEISDDKWIRMAAWIARHLGDLDSPQANPQHPNYPSAGVVAHLLWGSGPSKAKARTAMEYAQSVVERIRKEEERHLAGKHDQSTHGKGGGGMGRIPLDEETVQNMQGGSAQAHLRKNADGSWGFTPEREALHDQIVADALAGVPSSNNPTVVFLGGGAASGKSTALAGAKLDINDKHVTVNPDDVKKKLPEYKQKTSEEAAAFTHEESSYVAKRIQAAAVEGKKDIVVDAVGDTSASSMEKKISSAKSAGYRTIGTYVTIPTAEAQKRAFDRGVKEGRVVPPKVIAAGHRGVSNTFPQIASKFDEVALYNNEIRGNLRLIGSGKNGSFNVEDQGLWTEFLAKGSE